MKTVSRHGSTMSRATDHKYVLRPMGFIEFKHFFSPKVGVNMGEDQSARAVQTQQRRMIESELPSKSVSDSILSKALADKGMSIARRTLSKYRELINMPPVTQRKSVL